MDSVYLEHEASSGGPSADLTREPPMAAPRLIPVLDSPTLSMQLPSAPSHGGAVQVSAFFDRNCTPSQAPAWDAANYDRLSYG